MAPKAKPYEQFGPYILFKRLEADALGDLWRAVRIENNQLGSLVALRRLTGGDRAALLQSASEARAIVPLLKGTTFVKGQVIDSVDATPFLAFDYPGGRSLRHIVDRARGGAGVSPNPIPLDQAVLIAERVALSLATTADMRYGNDRLTHGAVLPQFIWITDDGEVRLAGQQLGKGIVASLKDPKVNSEVGRYFSPESQGSAAAAKASEIYSMGAILFLLVTGIEPPDPLSVTAFSQIVRAAKTMAGQPIPLEIRTILDRSLILDPASRYASIADMKQALDTLTGKQSATTFNLAFYLSTLLKKEFEAEALDREKESKVNVAPYTEIHVAGPTFESSLQQPAKRRTPLIAAALVAAIAVIGGAIFLFTRQSSPAPVAPRAAIAPAPKPKAESILSPINAMPPGAPTPIADPNAAKKAFEDAVNQKMQSEMLKLQSGFNKDLQQKTARNAPVITEAPPVVVAQPRPAPVAEERAPSAAALDERRLTPRQETTTQATVPVAVAQTLPIVQPPAAQPAPTPAQPTIREGDVVDVSDLDTAPRLLRPPTVGYPPMAIRQRVQTSVIVTALVSENGDVVDVRVLRGDPRFGFNEAAMRALRGVKFSPPIKDGKRVKTWFPQTINFKL